MNTQDREKVRLAIKYIHSDEAEGGDYDKGMTLLSELLAEPLDKSSPVCEACGAPMSRIVWRKKAIAWFCWLCRNASGSKEVLSAKAKKDAKGK